MNPTPDLYACKKCLGIYGVIDTTNPTCSHYPQGRPATVFGSLPMEIQGVLIAFAAEHGRTWRAKLRALWDAGRDEGALRWARNIIGPTDLYKVRLPAFNRKGQV